MKTDTIVTLSTMTTDNYNAMAASFERHILPFPRRTRYNTTITAVGLLLLPMKVCVIVITIIIVIFFYQLSVNRIDA